MKLEKHIEYIRNYIGEVIDGEQEFNIHELWEWLDSLLGDEEWEIDSVVDGAEVMWFHGSMIVATSVTSVVRVNQGEVTS